MSSFINIEYSKEHPGVKRVELAIEGALQLRKRWSASRGMAALLLTAMVAAVLVVAYEVMDSVVEGHLLVLWIALWAIGFASMALFSGTARQVAVATRSALEGWALRQARARADQRLWRIAQSDSRVMADIQAAVTRSEPVPLAAAHIAAALKAPIPRTLPRHYGYHV